MLLRNRVKAEAGLELDLPPESDGAVERGLYAMSLRSPSITGPSVYNPTAPPSMESPRRHRVQRSMSAGELSSLFAVQEHCNSKYGMLHTSEKVDMAAVISKAGTTAGAFVFKLYNMLCDPEAQQHISFTESGSSFLVFNATLFARDVLNKHYKHNNFQSFVRQLNMYGFHKVNKTSRGQSKSAEAQMWEFAHPRFHRDRIDLLDTIKRKAVVDDASLQLSSFPHPYQPKSPSPRVHDPTSRQSQHTPANLLANNLPTPPNSAKVDQGQFLNLNSPIAAPSSPSMVPISEFKYMMEQNRILQNQVDVLYAQQATLERCVGELSHLCHNMANLHHPRRQSLLVNVVALMHDAMRSMPGGQVLPPFPQELHSHPSWSQPRVEEGSMAPLEYEDIVASPQAVQPVPEWIINGHHDMGMDSRQHQHQQQQHAAIHGTGFIPDPPPSAASFSTTSSTRGNAMCYHHPS